MILNSPIESLEARRLMSASASLNSTLVIKGEKEATNAITLSLTEDGLGLVLDLNGTVTQYVLADVDRINIRGGRLADTISVDESNGQILKRVNVATYAGDDTITTGTGAARVFAGAGNDTVTTGAGNDTVRGLDGADQITTNGGNDRAHGGAGNDVISTGEGNDLARGHFGSDQIDLGDGDDRAFGEEGDDTLVGGIGNDTLWGGRGDDNIAGGAGNDRLGGIIGTNVLTGGDDVDTFVVRSLARNPANDFLEATDVLKVNAKSEDSAPTV